MRKPLKKLRIVVFNLQTLLTILKLVVTEVKVAIKIAMKLSLFRSQALQRNIPCHKGATLTKVSSVLLIWRKIALLNVLHLLL